MFVLLPVSVHTGFLLPVPSAVVRLLMTVSTDSSWFSVLLCQILIVVPATFAVCQVFNPCLVSLFVLFTYPVFCLLVYGFPAFLHFQFCFNDIFESLSTCFCLWVLYNLHRSIPPWTSRVQRFSVCPSDLRALWRGTEVRSHVSVKMQCCCPRFLLISSPNVLDLFARDLSFPIMIEGHNVSDLGILAPRRLLFNFEFEP